MRELGGTYLLLALALLQGGCLGALAWRALRLDESDAPLNPCLRWFFWICAGLALDMSALFVAGVLGVLTPTTLGIVTLAPVVGAALVFRPGVACLRGWRITDVLALTALFLLLGAEAIVVPGRFDDTMYHLPLAAAYAEHHGIVRSDFIRFSLFPQNMELLFAVGLMVGGEIQAQTFAVLPVLVVVLGLLGASVWLTESPVPGMVAAAVMWSLPAIRASIGLAYNDCGLLLFCLGATLALAVWDTGSPRRRGWLCLCAALAGTAAGVKLFGGVFAAVLVPYILVRSRSWRDIAAFCATAFVFAAGWYIRSAVIAGDPFSPLGGAVFGYFLWDQGDIAGQIAEQASYGVPKDVPHLLSGLLTARAEVLLVGLAGLVLILPRHRAARPLAWAFLSYYVAWFFTTQVDRYLAPIFATGCLLTGLTIHHCGARQAMARLALRLPRLAPVLPGLICALVLLPAAGVVAVRSQNVLADWQATLQTRPGYRLIEAANGMAPPHGARLVQLGFEADVYFFHGTMIGDWFGPGRYRDMTVCAPDCRVLPAAQMVAVLRRFDSDLLLVNTRRFALDLSEYQREFIVAAKDADGVLLRRRTE